MSGSTNVPKPVFGPNGYILPTESVILAGVQADNNAAFGGNLSAQLSTPQGQLASSLSAIIADCNDQFLLVTQGCDPAYATGRMQDGIGYIYFITRYPALPTTVQCTCTGLAGALIPTGTLVKDTSGNIYTCTSGGSFDVNGTVSLSFANIVNGPIPCPATTLSVLYQTVPGFDTITNPSDGVLGQNVETTAEFEARRQASVAMNANGFIPAITGAVLNVKNILDAYVIDNSTNSPIISDGVTIAPFSLYVCAAGGSSQDIAQAIWSKKSPGCAYSGNTTETVIDSNSGYVPPLPSYQVTFQTAVAQTFVILVTIKNSNSVPNNAASLIQTVILNAFAGADGGSRARIGSLVLASRYYGGIQSIGTWVEIINIKIGSNVAPTASFNANISSTTLTVNSVTSGTLGVGQILNGTNIPDGVQITALGSGTGGAGTYTINIAQNISNQSMVSILPTLDDVQVGIAHVPVLSAANILVVLQ